MIHRIGRIDTSAVIWLAVRRRPTLDRLMRGATRVGDGYVWGVFACFLWFLIPAGHIIVRQLALAYAIELSIYKGVKALFSRPRPFVMIPDVTKLIVPPDEFSFPSGHTAAAFVMVAGIGMHSIAGGMLLLPVGMAIGVSRVYLGVHYPSDVLAGAILGLASGIAGSVMI